MSRPPGRRPRLRAYDQAARLTSPAAVDGERPDPARGLLRPDDRRVVDLAVTVRPDPAPEWLRRATAYGTTDLVGGVADQGRARAAVAERFGRRPDEVLLTPGPLAGLALVAREQRPRRTVVVHPQRPEVEAVLRRHGHPVERVVLPPPYRLDPDRVPGDADLVVVATPTDPTSVLHPRAAVRALVRPGRLVVVDETWADTVPGEAGSLARDRLPGLVVLRPVTVGWGFATLPLGHLLADPDLVARFGTWQSPWPVSSPALAAAVQVASPRGRAELDAWAGVLAARREHLLAALADVPGVAVAAPPASSFVLLRVAGGSALRLRLRAAGLAVAPPDGVAGLSADHLRVAVPVPELADRLAAALAAVAPGPGPVPPTHPPGVS